MNPKDVYEMYCKHIKQKESKLEEKNKDTKITKIIVNFKNHNNNYLPHSLFRTLFQELKNIFFIFI